MTNNSNIKGFTLVEVIVVAVLVSVLALGVFSLFNMYISASRETSMYLKLQRHGEALVDEVTRMARHGAFIVKMDEDKDYLENSGFIDIDANVVYEYDPDPDNDFVTRFDVRDRNGDLLGCMQINPANGMIETSSVCTPGSWTELVVGGDSVTAVVADSRFEVWVGRGQVRLDVVLKTKAGNGEEYRLNLQRGAFRCRN